MCVKSVMCAVRTCTRQAFGHRSLGHLRHASYYDASAYVRGPKSGPDRCSVCHEHELVAFQIML